MLEREYMVGLHKYFEFLLRYACTMVMFARRKTFVHDLRMYMCVFMSRRLKGCLVIYIAFKQFMLTLHVVETGMYNRESMHVCIKVQ